MNNGNSTPSSTPGSTPGSMPGSMTDEARVGAEQIRVFYAETNTALLGNLLAVIATLVLLWDRVDQDYLKIWSGVTGAAIVFRLVIYRGFNADPDNVEAIRGWGPIFTTYTLVSGLCWGALSGVFSTSGTRSFQFISFAWWRVCWSGPLERSRPMRRRIALLSWRWCFH
ncbi:MAG: hypothetical protein P8N43_10305 [Alphaproteobacteria bacterium]|nr:hypothetical protein [Alphaproteobacteria bacterium]